ncbi:hypothetical protein P692DRAFT_20758511, partial [Suillus brevipes Sb2]
MTDLKVLDNIELRVQRCFRLLSAGNSDNVRRELLLLRKAVEKVKRKAELVVARKESIMLEMDALETQFNSCKPSARDLPVEFDTDVHYQSPVNRYDEIAQVALFIGVMCKVVMGVSRRGCDFIMGLISVLLFLTFRRSDGSLSSSHENVLRQIPTTFETALTKFHLTGKTVAYAICPSCHCTYGPRYAEGSTIPTYPERCTHRPAPEAECGQPLLEHGRDGLLRPMKTFIYHDFKDYLAGLLSRADIEAAMDQACDDLQDSINSPHPAFMKNAFEAQFLRQFCGPQPSSLFIDRGEEGRYAFAL